MPLGRAWVVTLPPIIMTIVLAVLGALIPIIHFILPTLTTRLLALVPMLVLIDFIVIVASMLVLAVLMVVDS